MQGAGNVLLCKFPVRACVASNRVEWERASAGQQATAGMWGHCLSANDKFPRPPPPPGRYLHPPPPLLPPPPTCWTSPASCGTMLHPIPMPVDSLFSPLFSRFSMPWLALASCLAASRSAEGSQPQEPLFCEARTRTNGRQELDRCSYLAAQPPQVAEIGDGNGLVVGSSSGWDRAI